MNDRKYYALYRRLKDDILRGTLPPGAKLPSKRALAERSGVSVITAEYAYRQLIDEGYVFTRERSGYFVQPIAGLRPSEEAAQPPLRMLSEEAPETREAPPFPYSVWFRLLRKAMSDYGERLMERSPNKGCARLRNAIAAYLLRCRGMFAQPEQIIIGSGSEQLYEAVTRILGTRLVYGIEYPSYGQIEAVYAGAGALVEHLPLASDGIESESLRHSGADVLHVTPFHSYPSGATAPAAKRYEYLQWASRPGRWLVEDDFDSEFFRPGKPPETLWSMDKDGSVIYINTFSKSLSPSMRMGYMILPESLLPQYDKKLGRFSCTVPLLEQYALAEFLDGGYFERHLNRMRRELK